MIFVEIYRKFYEIRPNKGHDQFNVINIQTNVSRNVLGTEKRYFTPHRWYSLF